VARLRARAGIICTFLLAVAGALLRCPPLAGRVSACKRIPFRRRIACDPKPLLHLAVLALRRVVQRSIASRHDRQNAQLIPARALTAK
jgi:hypothetical protein